MRHRSLLLVVAVVCPFLLAHAHAVPLANPGFEAISPAGHIDGWDLDRDTQVGEVTLTPERTGLPQIHPTAAISTGRKGGWDLALSITQNSAPYHVLTHVAVTTTAGRSVHKVEFSGAGTATMHFDAEPTTVAFNYFEDLPLERSRFYTWRNLIDDFDDTLIIYGTSREIEANHTLAERWQTTIADAYLEILPPLVKDSEIDDSAARDHDLIVIGSVTDNSFLAKLSDDLPVTLGRNYFVWHDTTYAASDDGIVLVVPNPLNPKRVLYLIIANSALQLHQMTKQYHRNIPSWAVFKSDAITDKGVHPADGMTLLGGR